ncbi:ABC transporter permease [Acinetobacter sp. MD2(2019)]|uniref:ABC transporter permease n=1 Tax=Acinetobacter sp. MD2(2019) TaxID=2605273 RepID=UPI002D1EA7C6|nr:ABC transporter permease [Acinetobacter sp. MD2(2019)]MEB3754431.1 ABC transporter permease [Acinetobacter sp. MD2(2019)]
MFYKSTFHEFIHAFKHPHQWLLLAWFDIKQRYRRSVLGPFWITISTAILISALGLLWSTLFKMPLAEYLPYFAVGNILWVFISTQFNESTIGFINFTHIIKQHRLPYPSYILRQLSQNIIIFLHNFILIFIIISFSIYDWSWKTLIAIPGFILLAAVTFFCSFIFAILSTRYRDLAPIIQNMIMVAYFMTPIMWQEKTLPEKYHWIIHFNPFAHLISLVRQPLLGSAPSLLNWLVSIFLLLATILISYSLLNKSRNRIAYWL